MTNQKTKVTPLDCFLEERAVTEIDIVKIVTEGYELKVLLGMEKTLRNNPSIKIFVELKEKFIHMAHSSVENFLYYLRQFDLTPWYYYLTTDGELKFNDEMHMGKESLVLFSKEHPLKK